MNSLALFLGIALCPLQASVGQASVGQASVGQAPTQPKGVEGEHSLVAEALATPGSTVPGGIKWSMTSTSGPGPVGAWLLLSHGLIKKAIETPIGLFRLNSSSDLFALGPLPLTKSEDGTFSLTLRWEPRVVPRSMGFVCAQAVVYSTSGEIRLSNATTTIMVRKPVAPPTMPETKPAWDWAIIRGGQEWSNDPRRLDKPWTIASDTQALRTKEDLPPSTRHFFDGRAEIACVIAHRGLGASAPENTIAAIDSAFELGAHFVEVDVRLTRDGKAVLLHDWTVDRTTNGMGLVATLDLDELKEFAILDRDGQPIPDASIPTLAEAFLAARGKGPLLLDVKNGSLYPVIANALIQSNTKPNEIWVFVPDNLDLLDAAARELPGTPLIFGMLPENSPVRFFEYLKARGVLGFDIPWKYCTKEVVADAHSHRMFVFSYTMNEPAMIKAALAMGIDGIETDVPRMALRLSRDERRSTNRLPLLVIGCLAGAVVLASVLLSKWRRKAG